MPRPRSSIGHRRSAASRTSSPPTAGIAWSPIWTPSSSSRSAGRPALGHGRGDARSGRLRRPVGTGHATPSPSCPRGSRWPTSGSTRAAPAPAPDSTTLHGVGSSSGPVPTASPPTDRVRRPIVVDEEQAVTVTVTVSEIGAGARLPEQSDPCRITHRALAAAAASASISRRLRLPAARHERAACLTRRVGYSRCPTSPTSHWDAFLAFVKEERPADPASSPSPRSSPVRLARLFVHGIVKTLLDREATEGTAQELSAVELKKRMDTLDGLARTRSSSSSSSSPG